MLCLRIRSQQLERRCRWTGQGLRILNEVPTLLLVGIIVAAVFKTYMSTVVIAVTLGVLALLLGLAIWAYKKARVNAN